MPKKDLNPQAVEMAMKLALAVDRIVFDPQISQQLLTIMQTGKPANALARAALAVIKGLQEKSKGLPPNAITAFIPQIIARLAELAEAAKLFQSEAGMLSQALAMVKQQGAQQPQPAQSAQSAQPAQPAEQPQGLIGAAMQGA
jgi:hypothetical protein